MATEPSFLPQGAPRPGARGLERRDANAPWIFGIVFFLVCSGIIIHLVLAGLFTQFKSQPAPRDVFQTIRPPERPAAADFPHLQVSPRLDLGEFRAWEDEQLTNYGWINRTAGIVRVPIARAMELVLSKGLPTRTNSEPIRGPGPADLIQQRSMNRLRESGLPQ